MVKLTTGCSGLDYMLGGGFPSNRIFLVRGGPGAGKTTFCVQFIMEGLKKNEPGIFVTFEEPLDLIKKNMLLFGVLFTKLIGFSACVNV